MTDGGGWGRVGLALAAVGTLIAPILRTILEHPEKLPASFGIIFGVWALVYLLHIRPMQAEQRAQRMEINRLVPTVNLMADGFWLMLGKGAISRVTLGTDAAVQEWVERYRGLREAEQEFSGRRK